PPRRRRGGSRTRTRRRRRPRRRGSLGSGGRPAQEAAAPAAGFSVEPPDFDDEPFPEPLPEEPASEPVEPPDSEEPDEPDPDERREAERLSVLWKPEPLSTMPTGAKTRLTRPPQPGCFTRGSSLIDWKTSNSSPHFLHR